MHDPTTKDRQGGDRGTQYRSAIFYHSEEQEKQAREVTKKVQEKWWKSGTVTTEILPAGEWWDAETYHQRYLEVCFALLFLESNLSGDEHFSMAWNNR